MLPHSQMVQISESIFGAGMTLCRGCLPKLFSDVRKGHFGALNEKKNVISLDAEACCEKLKSVGLEGTGGDETQRTMEQSRESVRDRCR